MHMLGSPSYRIEDTMDACSRALGLEGSFFSTPTAIFAALGEKGSEPKTSLLRVVPGARIASSLKVMGPAEVSMRTTGCSRSRFFGAAAGCELVPSLAVDAFPPEGVAEPFPHPTTAAMSTTAVIANVDVKNG